jgi:hypothetical protein
MAASCSPLVEKPRRDGRWSGRYTRSAHSPAVSSGLKSLQKGAGDDYVARVGSGGRLARIPMVVHAAAGLSTRVSVTGTEEGPWG